MWRVRRQNVRRLLDLVLVACESLEFIKCARPVRS